MPSIADLRKGLFQKRIDITKHFDGIEEKVYIVLREPTVQEVSDIAGNEEKAKDLWQNCVIDHSFTVDGKKESTKDVIEFLCQSISIVTHIVEEWTQSIPLFKAQAEKLGKLDS